jgi:hypothetical protein
MQGSYAPSIPHHSSSSVSLTLCVVEIRGRSCFCSARASRLGWLCGAPFRRTGFRFRIRTRGAMEVR